MAAREFQGVLVNKSGNPLFRNADNVDSGQWQEPFLPSRVPGAGRINPDEQGEWRSESDGIATGTSGWARWGVRVVGDVNDPGTDGMGGHFEFVQVNWGVPFYGAPIITVGVSRNDPGNSDAFVTPDQRPPVLEIVPTSRTENGNEGALAQAAEIAPYVFAIPWSFFSNAEESTHPRVSFTVRPRGNGQTRSPLTFPSGLPSRQQTAMEAFRNRTLTAPAMGFVAGFPTFHEQVQGRNHLSGTVFVTHASADWRDVPLVELGNVSLDDFAGRMRASNTWASQHGYIGGFPTFFHADYGSGIVCGTTLIKAAGAEFRDISLLELGSPSLDDFEARFRATQDYALREGFVGGFPTLFHAKVPNPIEVSNPAQRIGIGSGQITVCGAILFRKGERIGSTLTRAETYAAFRDVLLYQDPA
jgi:hypothetical protein